MIEERRFSIAVIQIHGKDQRAVQPCQSALDSTFRLRTAFFSLKQLKLYTAAEDIWRFVMILAYAIIA
jgi:hypothetical protein